MIGMTRRLSSDRGAVIVIVAAWMTSAIALVTFVIDVGHWYEHKRHLQVQVDAAAFGGGGMFAGCFNSGGGSDAIFREATKYAGAVGSWNGTSYGTAQYNAQIGASHTGTVSMLYQSRTYADGTNPNDGTETQAPCATPDYQFDVKGTEANVPLFLTGGAFVPAINAHARVQLQPLGAANPSLPLAAPDVNPRQVGVTFVNEATGNELTGCSGTNWISGCTFAMAKGTPVGALNIWSGPATVPLPTAPANVGVRIGLGGQVASCANTAGTRYYACFDGTNNSQGLYLIRDFASGGTVTTAPKFNGVWPTTNSTSCSGSPFFSDVQTGGASSCPAGVQAQVDFGTGATIPDTSQYGLTVKVANGQNGNTVSASMSPVAGSYDATRHTWLWQAANGSLSLDTGAGPQAISFDWTVKKGNAPICTGNQNCRGSTSTLHRFFSAPTNDPSGPIQQLSVTESGADAASLEGGTRALNITIGISGNFKVNKPCPSPPGMSGKDYTCFTYDPVANAGPDRAVLLRLKQTRGPNTYTVDCGGGTPPNNLRDQIVNGCQNAYSINTADICPDAGTPPTPPDCVPTQTGQATGQIRQGMNDRFAPGNPARCLPNTYPNITPGTDGAKRVVIVMITDFSAFNGGGSITVPVVTYGAFYVVGWDGAPSDCDLKNEPFSHTGHAGSSDTGDVWGHFITYVDGSASGTPGVCNPSALLPCVPVLTQ
jgi:hypothetical protein